VAQLGLVVAAAARRNLGNAAAAARRKLGSAAAAARRKLDNAAAAARGELGGQQVFVVAVATRPARLLSTWRLSPRPATTALCMPRSRTPEKKNRTHISEWAWGERTYVSCLKRLKGRA